MLGDIHANHLALEVVLDSARSKKVSKLLLTGDLVGYYFGPAKTLQLLKGWDFIAVRGNHEEMLRTARNNAEKLSEITNRYGSGIEIALEQLDSDEISFLCNLPHPLQVNIDGVSILLCHGSPLDVDQYTYPDTSISDLPEFRDSRHDLILMGHTHHAMDRKAGSTRVVNPGSVGQPRDRIPGAAWAVFDTADRSLTFHREDYDASELIAECSHRHPELPYLASVLTRT